MNARRLVVVSASAGGLDPLRTILSGIPDTFPAAIGIVLHTSPESPGLAPEILDRVSRIPVTTAFDGQRLEAAHAYFAPVDRHLVVEPGHLRVIRGPREHRFRPAIDPLFRSAAQVFGSAAIGVLLSGNLDDGTAGLGAISRLGGTAVVQEPGDAAFPSMVTTAIERLNVDYVLPASGVADLLARLTAEPEKGGPTDVPAQIGIEVDIAKEENPRVAGLEKIGKPSPFACPDCSGVLLEITEGGRIRFRCHTGHACSAESLLAAMNDGVEGAMMAAVRALEEAALLMRSVGAQLHQHEHIDTSRRMFDAADRARTRPNAFASCCSSTSRCTTAATAQRAARCGDRRVQVAALLQSSRRSEEGWQWV